MNYYVFLTEPNAGSPIKFLKNVGTDNSEDETKHYNDFVKFFKVCQDYFVNLIKTANPKNVDYLKAQAEEFLNVVCHPDILEAAENGFWYPTENIKNAILNSKGHFTLLSEYNILKCIKDEAIIYRVFERAIENAKELLNTNKQIIENTRKYSENTKRSKNDYVELEYTDYAFRIEEMWIKTRNMLRFVMNDFVPLNMKDSDTVCEIFNGSATYEDILEVCTKLFESIEQLNLKRIGRI